MSIASVIFPHQLFESSPALEGSNQVFLVEDPLFFSQYAFHRQKLMLHRASMKAYQHRLSKDSKVHYVEAKQLGTTRDLAKVLQKHKVKTVIVADPEDDFLRRRFLSACAASNIEVRIVPSPNFLTDVSTIDRWFENKNKLLFTQFYIETRKSLDILVTNAKKPVGGKWSFDTENRKRLPKGIALPKRTVEPEDSFAIEARAYVQKHFPDAIGEDMPLMYPSNPIEALARCESFVQDNLSQFGEYEDAIAEHEPFLFHSVLTPMLNIGLISPQQIVDKVLERADDVPLNSLEGFLRQVIGWREYMRASYRKIGVKQRTTNFWGYTRKIPQSFYTGTTGITPIDRVIKRTLKYGYCHHIERLMILGNFMLLCEFDPDEVYRWFMELFVDSYDWVMVPNVYGMSQFADGGLITTKPYVSGSNYVLRMSDFKKGDWCPIWDALYWRFMHVHRSFLESNPRMSLLTKQLDRMGAKLDEHFRVANAFLDELDSEIRTR